MKRSNHFFVIVLMAVIMLASCGEEHPTSYSVAGVFLNKSSLLLLEGDSETLMATVLPENAANKKVTWKTDNADVATVDNNGKVIAIKTGKAILTAITEDGGKEAVCEVTVDNFKISMRTTKDGEVSIYLRGTGTATIDWGDGMPETKEIDTPASTKFTRIGSLERIITINGDNITYLECSFTQLIALDISKNTNLKYLYCGFNPLTMLDVSNNTSLVTLECHYCQLTALDVSKNSQLELLICDYNQLTALDISKNILLKNLTCSDNLISTLDASKNTQMTWLYCPNNSLTSLDVSLCTSMTGLFCPNNYLTVLDISKQTMLKRMNCGNNQLTALNIGENILLESLSCNNNQLTTLDNSKNSLLTALICYDNLLTATALNAIFRNLPSIYNYSVIYISNNPGTDTCDLSLIPAGWAVY